MLVEVGQGRTKARFSNNKTKFDWVGLVQLRPNPAMTILGIFLSYQVLDYGL